MYLFKCPFLKNDMCLIASVKSSLECLPTIKDCKECRKCSIPMDDNEVTTKLIERTFAQYGTPVPKHLMELGPGTKIKLIVSKWVTPDENCGCNESIKTINEWGSEVAKHGKDLEDMLVQGAKRSTNPFIRIASYTPLPRIMARRIIRRILKRYITK